MIKRIYIHNFRCLENFELPISGMTSLLLIGKNGAGKSSVGFALQVLQSIARGTNRVGQLVNPKDFSRDRSDVPIRFEIEVGIDGRSYEYILALELPTGFKEIRVAEERLICDGADIYARQKAQVVLARTSTAGEAKFLVDWHLVALPLIQEASESDPLRIFKSWLARMLILSPVPSAITGESDGDSLAPNREVTNFGEHLLRRAIDDHFYDLLAKPRLLMGKHIPGIGLNQVYETNSVPQLGDIQTAMRDLAEERV